MFSLFRSQLFRIAKSPFFIIFGVAYVLVAAATPFALWLYSVWPAFAATGFVEVPSEPLSSLQLYGVSFTSGSILAMWVGIAVAELVSEDFKSGFMKNLVQARGGRVGYAASVVACCIALSAVTTAVGMMVVEGALRVQGYIPAAPTFQDAFAWFAQVALCVSAYASTVAALTVLTKSEVVGVMGAIFIGGGAIESAFRIVLANIPGLPVSLRDCLDGYLAVDMAMLGQGVLADPMTYVQAGATIAVAGAACALVMRRKNLR